MHDCVKNMEALFQLGSVVSTPSALQKLAEHYILPEDLLERHSNGDWGDLDAEDRDRNNEALLNGSRLFSSYLIADGIKVWIVIEAQNDEGFRSHTTIELPGDY